MAKYRSYTGQKKGQSLARQSKRSKVAGGGTGTGRGLDENARRDNAFFKPGALKNLVSNLIISAVVIAGLAIAVTVKKWDEMPSTVNYAIVIGCGVLIIIMLILSFRSKKRGDGNRFFKNPFLK